MLLPERKYHAFSGLWHQALLEVAINIFKVTTALIFRTGGGSKLFGSTGNHLQYCMLTYPRMPPPKFPPPGKSQTLITHQWYVLKYSFSTGNIISKYMNSYIWLCASTQWLVVVCLIPAGLFNISSIGEYICKVRLNKCICLSQQQGCLNKSNVQ